MSLRGTAAAVGIAVAIGGLGGAAIYAATDTPGMGPGRFAGGGPRAAGSFDPASAAREHADPATVRSETVLADSKGGFTTTVTQTGTITALSATALTVRSSDGFIQSYTLPTAGQPGATPPFEAGDTVLVRATRHGATLTVTSIGEPLDQPAAP
ncbi:hypothetical protein [Mycolicibacterium goodii]|uniref:DUF5666 domain-containing protein n=1 Tax=Mycolicibacterium goodii TaxID=134601 RepID=A0A0K0X6W0_MYCGD|nr:hypothetical protein AFA91_15540 [Mycolicibacterium goodii]